MGGIIKKDKSKYLFSFVVPVYNRPECAISCIDSILSQFDKSCELIIVDDGSGHSTRKKVNYHIYSEWNHLLSNIKVINQENSGCSAARNNGIEHADGEYITFIDGDDTLASNFIQYAKKLIEDKKSNNADLFIFEINYVDFDTRIAKCNNFLSDQIFENPGDFADAIIKDHTYLWYSQSNKLYKQDIINKNKIRFENGLSFGEDRIFNYDYLTAASGAIITSSTIMLNYYAYSYPTQSSSYLSDYWKTIISLHNKKLDCLYSICNNATKEEKSQYELYDITNEIRRAISRFKQHPEEEKETISQINSLIFPSNKDCDCDVDYLIVLGSYKCLYRIDKAYEFSCEHDVYRFVVSGVNKCAYFDGSEAEFMRNYLLEKNVDADQVLLENNSHNSVENISFSFDLINENICNLNKSKTSTDSKPINIGVVSGGFHLGRVKNIVENQVLPQKRRNDNNFFNNVNFLYIPAYGPNTRPDNWYKDDTWMDLVLNNFVG